MEDKVMDKLELAKKANEVRKGIVTAVHSAKADIPVDHSLLQICLLILF